MNKTYLSSLIRHVLHSAPPTQTKLPQAQEQAWNNRDKDRLNASLETLACMDEGAADAGE